MSIEIARLVSVYEADTKPFERAVDELPRISERALKSVTRKTEIEAKAQEIVQRSMANASIREQQRATREIIKEFEKRQRALENSVKTSLSSSVFRGSFAGTALGNLIPSAAQIVGNIPQQVSDLFNKGLNFDQSVMALSAITGGMDIATAKIQELERVAAATPGLSFLSAVDGQKRLEAVGFEANRATALLKNLSKVRVLSGSTKQDFDAVILNLTQIRAQGKLTGDELRETLGRMPYMARVINDAFGTIDTQKLKEMNLSSDEFFSKLIASMEKVPTVAGGAALAVENTADAWDRLQITVGQILDQNPEVIAMFRVIQDRLNQTTHALSDNESEVRKKTSSTISNLSRELLVWDNYAGQIAGFLTDIQREVSNWGKTWNVVLHDVTHQINYFFDDRLPNAIESFRISLNGAINSLVSGFKSLGSVIDLVTPGASNLIGMIPELDTTRRTNISPHWKQLADKAAQDSRDWMTKRSLDTRWQSWGEAKTRGDQNLLLFDQYREQERREMEGRRNTRYPQMKWNSGGAGGGDSDGAGKGGKLSAAGLSGFVSDRQMAQYQQALRSLSPALRAQIVSFAEKYGIPESLALAQIFSESSFKANAKSPFNKNVGEHAFGLTQVLPSTASRVLGEKTTGTQLFSTETALTAWGKYMTKLFNEFGDWELAAFAYHNGEGAARKFAAALDSGDQKRIGQFAKANPKGVAYARKIGGLANLSDATRFGMVDVEKQSKTATEEWKKEQNANIAKIFANLGLVSDEVVKTTVEERNKALEKIGKAQTVTEEAVRAEFLQNAQLVGNDVGKFTDIIMGGIGSLPENMQETVKQFLSVAHANKVYGDSAFPLPRTMDQLKSAFQQLTGVTRERIANEIPPEFRGDPNATRPRVTPWQLQPGTEWGLKHQGNPDEQRDGSDRQRIQDFNQFNQSLSDQLELLQRGNRPFTEYEITQRDIIRNYAHLDPWQKQDLLNTAAKIDAQQRLNGILGERKTINDIVLEAQAGLVQDTYGAINSGIDALIAKMGLADTAVGNFFQTMLSGLAKLAINKVFEMLFGGGVGGVAGGNSGGGWLSKLIGIGINFIGGLFGGGGGSSHEVGHFGRFAEGGLVIGGIPNKDSVPIMAMPGEFVAKTDAVNYYGPDYFAALNAKKIKKFSEGGLVGNSFNFNQSSVKNYAGNQNFSHLQKQASASNGQNVTIHLSQNFQANPKTGAFSKESADQAARAAARALNNAMRRS